MTKLLWQYDVLWNCTLIPQVSKVKKVRVYAGDEVDAFVAMLSAKRRPDLRHTRHCCYIQDWWPVF